MHELEHTTNSEAPDLAQALLTEADERDATSLSTRRTMRLLWTSGGLTAGSAFIGWQAMGAQSIGLVVAASATLLVASLGVGWMSLRALNPKPRSRPAERRSTQLGSGFIASERIARLVGSADPVPPRVDEH